MNRVFVYGSLRTPNKEATHTLEGFKLLDFGRFPGVTPEKGFSTKGEILEVDDEELARMDHIEGTASGFYTREKVVLDGKDTFVFVAGKVLEADWIKKRQHVVSGDWFNHPDKQQEQFKTYRNR